MARSDVHTHHGCLKVGDSLIYSALHTHPVTMNDWLDLGIGGRGWRYSGDWFLMYSD